MFKQSFDSGAVPRKCVCACVCLSVFNCWSGIIQAGVSALKCVPLCVPFIVGTEVCLYKDVVGVLDLWGSKFKP